MKGRSFCAFLIIFTFFGTFAQPDPCGCEDGYVYMPPGSLEDYPSCDPFNLIEYCVPAEVPINDSIYVLGLLGVLYGVWVLKPQFRKAAVYKSK